MKKLNKMRMVRAGDAFLPGVFLIASALGKANIAESVFMFTFFARLLALASARGLRQAFSEQPSLRRVRGSVKTALLLQLFGALAVLGADFLRNRVLVRVHLIYIGAALLLNIEHVFYEYLCATGDGHSATLCRAITSALMAGGIMMTSINSNDGLLPYALEWTLGAAALSAAVSALIGLSIGGPLKGKLNPQVIKCAPLSMAQTLIYPLLWLCLTLIPGSPLRHARTGVPLFAGLIVYELCRAPFRRTSMESKEMNRALLITAAVALAVLGGCYVPQSRTFLQGLLKGHFNDLPATAVSILAGCASAFAFYGSI